jgi:diaminohydroxyphosphoribosylaminopyrimidine deaminase/5-amino-6-(5-phosphoribosylamino)uracil reductase
MESDDPMAWLTDLYRRGVTSVMVEGGTRVLQQMIYAHTWDEARIEVSPRRVGQGTAAPVIEGRVHEQYLVDGNQITYLVASAHMK